MINHGLVTVDCETNYPFEDVFIYKIQAEKPFDLYVRQPTWATKATLTASGSKDATFNTTSGLHKISIQAGISTATYIIDTSIRIEPRANDTIAIYRGALLYAFEVAANITSTGPHHYRNLTLYSSDYAPPQAKDYIMLNATAWNIAIDPSTIVYHPRANVFKPLPTPIFASGKPPMYMTAKACLIEWELFNGTTPGWPIALAERKCLGDVFEAKLVPYGSAKLRMSEIAVIDLKGK